MVLDSIIAPLIKIGSGTLMCKRKAAIDPAGHIQYRFSNESKVLKKNSNVQIYLFNNPVKYAIYLYREKNKWIIARYCPLYNKEDFRSNMLLLLQPETKEYYHE